MGASLTIDMIRWEPLSRYREPRAGRPMTDIFSIPTKESLADGNLREVRWLPCLVDDVSEWCPRWLDTSRDLMSVLGKRRAP